MFAIQKNNESVADQLLNVEGIDVNSVDRDGMTCLMRASAKGLEQTVNCFLTKLSINNIIKTDRWGRSALMYAIHNKNDSGKFCSRRFPCYQHGNFPEFLGNASLLIMLVIRFVKNGTLLYVISYDITNSALLFILELINNKNSLIWRKLNRIRISIGNLSTFSLESKIWKSNYSPSYN